MKLLRQMLDQAEPAFKKGAPLERLYPAFEMIDTFLYTPADVTKGASHVRDSLDLKRTMIMVVAALLPCIFMAMWNTGYQANLALASLGADTAGGWRGVIIAALEIGYTPGSFLAHIFHSSTHTHYRSNVLCKKDLL